MRTSNEDRKGTLRRISHQLISLSKQNVPYPDFLRRTLQEFLEPYGCARIVLWLREGDLHGRLCLERDARQGLLLENGIDSRASRIEEFENLVRAGTVGPNQGHHVSRRSARSELEAAHAGTPPAGSAPDLTTVLLPIGLPGELLGLLELELEGARDRAEEELLALEGVAQAVGFAISSRRAQDELRERVKELTCLYGIAKKAARPGISLDDLLQGIVEGLPPAWQYPEIACARIEVDGRRYDTPGFQQGALRQTADIIVEGIRRGSVEVTYTQTPPSLGASPFLKWEERLVVAVARQVALIIERRQSEEERQKLQEQLRHADRLATIGQLTAGVAHELNEPLANILGFAQLTLKNEHLPEQVKSDIKRVEAASLHAREVIRKLMIFSRQMPQRSARVNLNQVVEDGLYFLASRCEKAGVELVKELSTELPEIDIDPSQMNQVLVNVVVNAVQAMPDGGVLSIRTDHEADHVLLSVTDTGIGMTEEVRRQVFLPFFTTKDVDRGTGLGLAVVHGIVTSFGGEITVETEPGAGSRFTIRIPLHDTAEHTRGTPERDDGCDGNA